MNRRTLTLAAILSVLASASGGCAYSVRTSSVPSHLKTVAIPAFQNQTSEYYLQNDITQAVIQRFVSNNALKVVDERHADAVLRGTITFYNNAVFGFTDARTATEYRVTIAVSVELKDVVKNRVMWSDANLSKYSIYNVTDAPGQNANTEAEGRTLCIAKIADEILARSVEAW